MLICIISPIIFVDYIKREFFKRQYSTHDVELHKRKYSKKGICHIHGGNPTILKDGLTMFSITHPSEIDPKISELIDYYVIKNNKKTLTDVYCDALKKYVNVNKDSITTLKDNQYILYDNINGESTVEYISHSYDQYSRSLLELDDNVNPIEKYRYKNISISYQATNITMSTLYEYSNITTLEISNNNTITTLHVSHLEYITTLHIDNCKSLRKLPNLPICTTLICTNCSLVELPLLPKKMDHMNVSNNKLTYIIKLPKMDYCNISHNAIGLLPKIYCKDFVCSYNLLTYLKLSSKVIFLTCNNNRLQELSTRNVMILDCSYNNIRLLKGMSKVVRLVCNNNRIPRIPNSKYVQYINCSYNEGIDVGSHKELRRLEAICSNAKINASKMPNIVTILIN